MNGEKKDLVKFDYEKTLAYVDKADGFLFQIRNWAIVSASAIVAYSVQNDKQVILAANLFIIPIFCLYELVNKSFHNDCIGKSYRLEEILEKSVDPNYELPQDYKFGIGHAIGFPKVNKMKEILFNKSMWHLGFLYAALLLMTLLAAIYTMGK